MSRYGRVYSYTADGKSYVDVGPTVRGDVVISIESYPAGHDKFDACQDSTFNFETGKFSDPVECDASSFAWLTPDEADEFAALLQLKAAEVRAGERP